MKKVILCVDDEAIILMSLKIELENTYGKRYVYETAISAEQALLIIEVLVNKGVEVVLIISDWLMPGIKGDVFLEMVKLKYPAIQTIMITGQADKDSIDRVLSEGIASSVLSKPWDSEGLKKAIDSCCQPA